MNQQGQTDRVDTEFAEFFRALGFDVTWDLSSKRVMKWHEIYDGKTLLCQVDFGTPLAAFLEDLVPLAAGAESGTSAHDYVCSCDDTAKLRTILDRVNADRNRAAMKNDTIDEFSILLSKAEQSSRMWQRRALEAEKELLELRNKIAADSKMEKRRRKQQISR